MSRRRTPDRDARTGTHARATVFCKCGTPTRDGAFICDVCLDELAVGLHELLPSAGDRPDPVSAVRFTVLEQPIGATDLADLVVEWCPLPRPTVTDPGLWASLHSVIAGERGIDYRALGGGSGGAVETGLVLDETAVQRASHLRKALRQLVIACMSARVEHTAPDGWAPRAAAEVPAMVEWLAWRVTGLAWNPVTAMAAHALIAGINDARTSVDIAPARQNLGPCVVEDCDGHYRPMRDETFATCSKCGCWVEAQLLRDWLIGELEESLVTAAEAAKLSTYLGLRAGRDRVRNLVKDWSHRRRLIDPRVIDWTPGLCPWPAPTALRFRFGTVYDLLLDYEENFYANRPERSDA
jgi:hypothetical protein